MLAYQRGDVDAFNELYTLYSGRVWAYLGKKVLSSDREDLFQAVWLKFHQCRDKYSAKFPFEPWFFTLIRNFTYDFYRQQNAQKRRAIYSEYQDLQNYKQGDQTETSTINTDFPSFHGLAPKPLQALKMRYEQDQSFEDIAKNLGTNPTNVRKMISRAINFLRREK